MTERLLRILAVDPSSTICGWALMLSDGQLIEAGHLKPRPLSNTSWQRVMQMADDLEELCNQLTPDVILVEWTTGKVGDRHQGGGAGLGVYGTGVGAIGRAAVTWARRTDDVRVVPVWENEWTRGVNKRERQAAVAAQFPAYRQHQADDTGADICDAIAMAEWWRKEQLIRGAI